MHETSKILYEFTLQPTPGRDATGREMPALPVTYEWRRESTEGRCTEYAYLRALFKNLTVRAHASAEASSSYVLVLLGFSNPLPTPS